MWCNGKQQRNIKLYTLVLNLTLTYWCRPKYGTVQPVGIRIYRDSFALDHYRPLLWPLYICITVAAAGMGGLGGASGLQYEPPWQRQHQQQQQMRLQQLLQQQNVSVTNPFSLSFFYVSLSKTIASWCHRGDIDWILVQLNS